MKTEQYEEQSRIDYYEKQFQAALGEQPRRWENGAIQVINTNSAVFPEIGQGLRPQIGPACVPEEPAALTGKSIEVRPRAFSMSFSPDKTPTPEKLAQFLDAVLWRLCTGGPLGDWNLQVDPILELPEYSGDEQRTLFIRQPWTTKHYTDPMRLKSYNYVTGRFGAVNLALIQG